MAHTSAPHIFKQRALIDRIALAHSIDELAAEQGDKARAPILALLQKALADGRAEIARRLMEHPSAGNRAS